MELRRPTDYLRAPMRPKTKKTAGSVIAGCGCLLLLLLSAWLCFVTYVGLQGRGNDEEVSLVIGAISYDGLNAKLQEFIDQGVIVIEGHGGLEKDG